MGISNNDKRQPHTIITNRTTYQLRAPPLASTATMAPVDRVDHNQLERMISLWISLLSTLLCPPTPSSGATLKANLPPPAAEQLRNIIQDLYQVMVQVSTYDTTSRPSKEVLSNEM